LKTSIGEKFWNSSECIIHLTMITFNFIGISKHGKVIQRMGTFKKPYSYVEYNEWQTEAKKIVEELLKNENDELDTYLIREMI
jgi:hypothetical protein